MAHGKLIAAILTVLILVLSGCAQLLPPGFNTTGDPTSAVVTDIEETEEDLTILDEEEELEEEIEEVEEMEEVVEEPAEEPEVKVAPAPIGPEDADLPRKTVVEGELVHFPNLQATDPDGDPIAYTFTSPLDAEGEWQTKVGDEGNYKVTVTASDGKNSVEQAVIIEVQSQNKAPEIKLGASKITIKEGETVTLDVTASDPEGDEVTLTFGGWMNSTTKETDFDDAGFHEVKVIATDGTKITEETIQIMVENVNRPPVIEMLNDVTVTEGDRITVKPIGIDPDGDAVTFKFSSPLSADGFWRTTKIDIGTYRINITASDGKLTAVANFMVVVESLNKAPAISIADLIKVEEGQTVTLSPEITDPEGDELTITYSGWMNANTYQTNYEDEGSHLVTITVSDGINTAKKDVTVMVDDVNRAPTFGSGAFS